MLNCLFFFAITPMGNSAATKFINKVGASPYFVWASCYEVCSFNYLNCYSISLGFTWETFCLNLQYVGKHEYSAGCRSSYTA